MNSPDYESDISIAKGFISALGLLAVFVCIMLLAIDALEYEITGSCADCLILKIEGDNENY